MLSSSHAWRSIDRDVMRRDLTGWDHVAWDRIAPNREGRGHAAWSSAIAHRVAAFGARRNAAPRWWEDLIGPVSRRTARKLDNLGRRRVAAEGRTIVGRGDRADAFYLIEEGRVAVMSPHSDDDDIGVPTAILGPGEWFGGIAMSSQTSPSGEEASPMPPRTVSIHAVEGCQLRMFRRAEILTLMELAPAAAAAINERAVGMVSAEERASVAV